MFPCETGMQPELRTMKTEHQNIIQQKNKPLEKMVYSF